MFRFSVIFLVVAMIAGAIGFSAGPGTIAAGGQFLFFLCLTLCATSFMIGIYPENRTARTR